MQDAGGILHPTSYILHLASNMLHSPTCFVHPGLGTPAFCVLEPLGPPFQSFLALDVEQKY